MVCSKGRSLGAGFLRPVAKEEFVLPARRTLFLALMGTLCVVGCLNAQSGAVGDEPGEPTSRLVAIADIHGAYQEFVELLQETKLIDDQNRWVGGQTTLVQTGDFLDRGKEIRKTMDLLRSLQEQAAAAGGEVVVLLGNHEAMNLLGFRRDVNPESYEAFMTADSAARQKAEIKRFGKWLKQRARQKKVKAEKFGAAEIAEFEKEYPLGYFEFVDALEPGGEYGDWLRSLPMIAVRDHIAFLHGGISPKYTGWSVDELNQRMRQEVQLLDTCRAELVEDGIIFTTSDPNEMVIEGLAEIAALTERLEKAPPALRENMIESLRLLRGCVGYEEWFLVKEESPIWYRGYARLEPEEELLEVVTRGLEGLGVNRFVVGHTPQSSRRVTSKLDGRVFLLDTGMLTRVYKGRGSALEFVGDTVTAIYTGGERIQFEPKSSREPAPFHSGTPPNAGSEGTDASDSGSQGVPAEPPAGEGRPPLSVARSARPIAPAVLSADWSGTAVRASFALPVTLDAVGSHLVAPTAAMLSVVSAMTGNSVATETPKLPYVDANGKPLPFETEEDLVKFLTTGKVVFVGTTELGVNRPRKVTVSRGGVEVDAVFRTVDKLERKVRTKFGNMLALLRDTYRFEPAAYRLNQFLGLNRVPPAVLRTLDGKRGSLQIWMHGTMPEIVRTEQGHQPKDRTSWRRQIAEAKLFDRLIGNVDRNQGNLLIDLEEEKIWLIDHTRSFAEMKTPHELEKVTRSSRAFWEALRSAELTEVQAMMEPYLLDGEMKALWSRWQKIVKRFERLLDEYDEEIILY